MSNENELRTGMTNVLLAIKGIDGKIDLLDQHLGQNDETTKELRDTILGDGGEGLVTKVAVIKSGLHRAWWFIGAIFILLASIGVKAFLT